MKNRAKRAGDLSRTATCPFCGGTHRRRSKQFRECRRRADNGQPPPAPQPEPPTAAPRHPGTPTTHYETDPLRGDKRAHHIARLLRQGTARKKIAKRLDIPVADVDTVAAKLERRP